MQGEYDTAEYIGNFIDPNDNGNKSVIPVLFILQDNTFNMNVINI